VLGGKGDDQIDGGSGKDQLFGYGGRDTIQGGENADDITGGRGADVLSGSDGIDYFYFDRVADSRTGDADRITDLDDSDDVIFLRRIDADTTHSGNQAFVLVDELSGDAGELALRYDAGSNRTFLEGDVDGDGEADLTIVLDGDHRDFDSFVL
jgi:Ca2+-binding RTX toxin-like protein